MYQRSNASIQDISEMRDIGRALTECGFVELNVEDGSHTWIYDFITQKTGYTLEEMKKLDFITITPEEFHESASVVTEDIKTGRGFKFSIRPIISTNGKITWWYSIRIETKLPYVWFRSEYLNTTDKSGSEYASMAAVMQTANSYNELYNKIYELQLWTEGAVGRLDKKYTELENRIMELAEIIRQTKRFAETAANSSLELKQAMINFQVEVANEMSKQTTEIMRLISADTSHNKRFEIFEEKIQQATLTAMKSITMRANEAGNGLAKKVSIPVSAISAVAIIIQWVISRLY